MNDSRERKAKLNIVVSLLCQIITLLCGLVVPRVMIMAFGSEAYGATSSITQFLAYIALLEGGISGVARAALYKPLANNDIYKISQIMNQIQKFFRKIGYIFVVYVAVLAIFFNRISQTQYSWLWTFSLVIIISISTFAQYFIGISYSVLIQAAQRTYITQAISIIATILNTVLIIILVNCGCNLLIVKLVSSCVFAFRPIAMSFYVHKKYKLIKHPDAGDDMLKQRWTAFGQHLAYFLHSNTDIAVLTIFSGLKSVAVYAIYSMVVSNIQTVITSFSAGMEALFGDMLAKGEQKKLESTFNQYETMISVITCTCFSTTMVLIVPFVKLYTRGVQDVNYTANTFAILLSIASVLYCLRQPYHSLVTAAGHFKQTKYAAYGEAVLNIVISVVLVKHCGLIGVAIGTVVSVGFRFVFYVIYINKKILKRNIYSFLKRSSLNAGLILFIVAIGDRAIKAIAIDSYFTWVLCGFCVVVIAGIIVLSVNACLYKKDTDFLINKLRKR